VARKGMGLGLAIVRRFADLLEHPIHVVSQPGRGSCFSVRAPRVATLRASRMPAAPRARSRPRTQLAGRLVAVLDDDPAAIDAMRALFATWQADVAGATSAEALLDDIGHYARYPDLIVADLRLQGAQTGVDAIARLQDELGTPIPALIVTGDTGVDAARIVRDAGLPLLAKPVDASALEDAAVELLGVPA